MDHFEYSPAPFIPFRDKQALDRVRNIKREDMDKHPNPDFEITIVKNDDVGFLFVEDMFYRIKQAADAAKPLVIIAPNPNHGYIRVAHLINKFRVNCEKLHIFNMDEFANEHGQTAPESWPQSFMGAMKKYFYSNIDEDLRPPEKQILGPTTENIKDYSNMIADLGGADICYSGPGWTGHIAFVEPDAPEFDCPLGEWKTLGARIVTLSPFTIAQNSLHGSFGMSGDMAVVPPKAATIGPADVIAAKARWDTHALTTAGTFVSWQRLITRLCLHGPVTPKVPGSLMQTLKTNVIVSEAIAADIEPIWNKGY